MSSEGSTMAHNFYYETSMSVFWFWVFCVPFRLCLISSFVFSFFFSFYYFIFTVGVFFLLSFQVVKEGVLPPITVQQSYQICQRPPGGDLLHLGIYRFLYFSCGNSSLSSQVYCFNRYAKLI